MTLILDFRNNNNGNTRKKSYSRWTICPSQTRHTELWGQWESEWRSGQVWVTGRGYTHSIVAGVALREPSCQFSTGTGMQVSLMVSWQRRERSGGPLSSSSWALLWTVSTTEGGGGAEGTEVRGWRFRKEERARYAEMETGGREEEGGKKKTRKTQKHMKQEQLNVRQEKSQALSEPHFFWTTASLYAL